MRVSVLSIFIISLFHYFIISLFHYFIISLFHYFIISLFHYFIISLFHYFIISLFHYFIISLFHYFIISLFHYFIISLFHYFISLLDIRLVHICFFDAIAYHVIGTTTSNAYAGTHSFLLQSANSGTGGNIQQLSFASSSLNLTSLPPFVLSF